MTLGIQRLGFSAEYFNNSTVF